MDQERGARRSDRGPGRGAGGRVMAGFRKMLEVWPVVAVSGISFALTQFLVSNLLGPELANQLKLAILTIASILGLAYLLNYSGLTYTLGLTLAATGSCFRCSPH